MVDREKCARPIGAIDQWCAGMAMALEGAPQNGSGKGLSVSVGWAENDPPATRPRILHVVYLRKARDAGIILNTCPWCGERIRFDELAERRKETGT